MPAHRLIVSAAVAAIALGVAAPAAAASYIRFEGVDGEFIAAPNGPARAKGHEGSKGWIEISSVQFGPTSVPAGVLSAALPPPAAGLTKVGPGTLVLSRAMAGCRVGARYPRAEVRQGVAGKLIRLEGVVVRSCSSESFSLNYAKVTW